MHHQRRFLVHLDNPEIVGEVEGISISINATFCPKCGHEMKEKFIWYVVDDCFTLYQCIKCQNVEVE